MELSSGDKSAILGEYFCKELASRFGEFGWFNDDGEFVLMK